MSLAICRGKYGSTSLAAERSPVDQKLLARVTMLNSLTCHAFAVERAKEEKTPYDEDDIDHGDEEARHCGGCCETEDGEAEVSWQMLSALVAVSRDGWK